MNSENITDYTDRLHEIKIPALMNILKYYWLLLILLVGSCTTPPKKYVIGVSQCSVDIWRDKLNREIKTCEYLDESLDIRLASAHDNSKQQSDQINAFIDQGVNLLIVAPNQYDSINQAIERAYAKGIPVILYDRKTSTNKYTAIIGADNYGIGKTMAYYIGEQLQGKGKVVEIRGLNGSSPAIDRHRGFVDGLKSFPAIQLVASEIGDWKEESGMRAMERILAKTQDFDYVFGQNDRMALGALKVLKKHGLHHRVRFAGVDGLANHGGGLELVRDRIFDATCIYPTQGEKVIALAKNILEKKPYNRVNLLNTTIITNKNAATMLQEAREVERQIGNLEILHSEVDRYFEQYNYQRIMIILFVLIIVMMIVTVVVLYRTILAKSQFNKKLKERNDELQRLSQEVEEMTQAQLSFFTNVSHELRTPITLISDPLHRLRACQNIKGESLQLLDMSIRNTNVLKQLVDEILDFRKIQNGKMTLKLSEFNMVTALETWMNDFKSIADQKGITITLSNRVTTDGKILADRYKLEHIYYNLMSNALKYTPSGQSVTTCLSEESDTYVIQVIDTGVGIAAADLPHIFDKFYQGKMSAGGTGIGLALVKAYTLLHHGTATVTSVKNEGSTFIIRLPKTQTEGEMVHAMVTDSKNVTDTSAKVSVKETLEGQCINGPVNQDVHLSDIVTEEENDKPEILIIDDNNDMREYLRILLKAQYHVLEAVDGKIGLSMARKQVPDIIICDIMMPVMDGLEFTRALKKDTVTSHIPVILLSARSLDEQKVQGYQEGADSYITKPFQADVLIARIDNLLKSREHLHKLMLQSQQGAVDLPSRTMMSTSATLLNESKTDDFKTSSQLKPTDKDTKFIELLRKSIQDNLGNSDLSVEQIGAEIGLSRIQLYRKVKALTGKSPVELIRTSRLTRGRKLIETTDMTISEIAYTVGFSSSSYFTKCFKDEFGIGPNELRV